MLSLISIDEFADMLYPPVHNRRAIRAISVSTHLRNAGISDLGTLIRTSPEQLVAIKFIGPVFVAQANAQLRNIDCTLGMSDEELKELLVSNLDY